MAEWIVSVPIVGRMTVYVEAETEAEARHKALSGDTSWSEIDETEVVEQCRGNVCHLSGGIDVQRND